MNDINRYNVTYSCEKNIDSNKYGFNKQLPEYFNDGLEKNGSFKHAAIEHLFDSRFGDFGCFYLKQRYLLIVGPNGKFEENDFDMSNCIICFDFIKQRWFLINVKLPSFIIDNNAFVLSKNESFIDIFGKVDQLQGANVHYRLYISVNISWQLQRLIWIAFHENEQNDKCFVALLSKDVVKYILSFLCGYSLFNNIRSWYSLFQFSTNSSFIHGTI